MAKRGLISLHPPMYSSLISWSMGKTLCLRIRNMVGLYATSRDQPKRSCSIRRTGRHLEAFARRRRVSSRPCPSFPLSRDGLWRKAIYPGALRRSRYFERAIMAGYGKRSCRIQVSYIPCSRRRDSTNRVHHRLNLHGFACRICDHP